MACRLCLYIFEEGDTAISSVSTEDYVSSDYVLALSLIPELDFELSSQVVMCKACVDTLRMFRDFGETCTSSAWKILSYKKQHGRVNDLKDVVSFHSPGQEDNTVDSLICCTCLKHIGSSQSRNLLDEPFLGMFLSNIISMKDILSVPLPVLCIQCTCTLEELHDFKRMCVKTQGSIKSYRNKSHKVLGNEDLVCVAKIQGVKQVISSQNIQQHTDTLEKPDDKKEQTIEQGESYHDVALGTEEIKVRKYNIQHIDLVATCDTITQKTLANGGANIRPDIEIIEDTPQSPELLELFDLTANCEDLRDDVSVSYKSIVNNSEAIKHKIAFLGTDFKCEACHILTTCKHLIKRHINNEINLRTCDECTGIILPYGNGNIRCPFRCFFCTHRTTERFLLFMHICTEHPTEQVKWPSTHFEHQAPSSDRQTVLSKHLTELCIDQKRLFNDEEKIFKHQINLSNDLTKLPHGNATKKCPKEDVPALKKKKHQANKSKKARNPLEKSLYCCEFCDYQTLHRFLFTRHGRQKHAEETSVMQSQ